MTTTLGTSTATSNDGVAWVAWLDPAWGHMGASLARMPNFLDSADLHRALAADLMAHRITPQQAVAQIVGWVQTRDETLRDLIGARP